MSDGGKKNDPYTGSTRIEVGNFEIIWENWNSHDHGTRHGLSFHDVLPAFSSSEFKSSESRYQNGHKFTATVKLEADRIETLEQNISRDTYYREDRLAYRQQKEEGRIPDRAVAVIYYRREGN